jgi:hypothetical protein
LWGTVCFVATFSTGGAGGGGAGGT